MDKEFLAAISSDESIAFLSLKKHFHTTSAIFFPSLSVSSTCSMTSSDWDEESL